MPPKIVQRRHDHTIEDKKQILREMQSKGWSMRHTAKYYNLSHSCLSRWLKTYDMTIDYGKLMVGYED